MQNSEPAVLTYLTAMDDLSCHAFVEVCHSSPMIPQQPKTRQTNPNTPQAHSRPRYLLTNNRSSLMSRPNQQGILNSFFPVCIDWITTAFGDALRCVGRPLAVPPLPQEGPHTRDARKAIGLQHKVKEQMDFYGNGHPQAGQLAVTFALTCNDIARGCMQEGRLKLAQEVLDIALHLLKLDHSALWLGENQKALALTDCNMGTLLHKKRMPHEALKWILRHHEALDAAKRSVDILCKAPNWHKDVSDASSEAGELLPIAFNNLAIEFEHVGDAEMASQSYGYAADFAAQRWGDADERTRGIRQHMNESSKGEELGHISVDAALAYFGGTRKINRRRKSQSLRVVSEYAETTSPVERAKEKAAGWHSPRFWSLKDGMKPRRMSPYNKDIRQIGLEMADSLGPALFPSFVHKTHWGESRLMWRDIGDADMSRIDGSVPSRSRLFSDIATNTKLNAVASVHSRRREIASRYPKNYAVYKAAKEMADLVAAQTLRSPSPSMSFLAGTHLLKPVRIH